MSKVVVTEFVSLDGVMEAPGGGEDFKHAGWTFKINRGEEGDQFKLDETRDAEALLLGRVTYEGFAVAWPSLKGDVVEEVQKLRQRLGGNIVVHGSAQLVQTLVEHDLVDELRLMVFPVVLGTGKRLFGDTSDKKPLRLVNSKTVGDGIAILIYEPARNR